MMSSMVWLMISFTLSVSASAMPCSPMLNDASLVLPSYLHRTNTLKKHSVDISRSVFTAQCGAGLLLFSPDDRREVRSYLGFDESFVEGRVWSRDHQRGHQAESESFKRVCDAAHTHTHTDQLLSDRLKASNVLRCLVELTQPRAVQTSE